MATRLTEDDIQPPAVVVPITPSGPPPVRRVNGTAMTMLGQKLDKLFQQYASDRRVAELKWMRNLRQYLGIYDPDVEKQMAAGRSRAYPRITRVKCISVLSRIMNLMFPGNERNWEIRASPSADMSPEDVVGAVQGLVQRNQAAGLETALDDRAVRQAVQGLAEERARELSRLIDDQLQELGGDQTSDYVALNRKVAQSGIMYSLGVLRGPFVRTQTAPSWSFDPATGQPVMQERTQYKPQYEFLPVWDFYPDMSAKNFHAMDGYFIRLVLSRSQLRRLADREDFFDEVIRKYLDVTPQGNYRPREFESELKSMGVAANVNEQKAETAKFEVLCWYGPLSGQFLKDAGVEIRDGSENEEIEAEVWMVGGKVIKVDMNPWRRLGLDVKTIHTFLFDEDDTSLVGSGMPDVMRDSQMSVAAAARMLLDNASVVCGPNIELNTDLLRMDQDLTAVSAYKIWYREGDDVTAQWPAVRNIQIDAHMDELLKVIELFMRFADAETFVGPATGGDMAQAPSEPMRTAAGASMLRSDAALPFKDIVRNFDSFTQSVITSLIAFNRKFNPDRAQAGDFNVIARGATSLIAKEIRGMQVDTLAATLTPDERIHVDERKLVEARFAVRDLDNMLVPEAEAERRQAMQAQAGAEQQEAAMETMRAEIRKTLAEAFKNITQGQKNAAAADAAAANTALDILAQGMDGTDDSAS